MFVNLVMIIVVDLFLEFVFEQWNQSSLEPFEKLQAKTRYLNKKRVWHYSSLLVVLTGTIVLCYKLHIHIGIINVSVGLVIALFNTLFENTVYDKMRNTLR